MWQCSHCNEVVDNNFDTCWNCSTQRDPNAIRIGSKPDELAEDAIGEMPVPPEMQLSGGMSRRELATIISKSLALLMFAQAAFLSVSGIILIVFEICTAPFRGLNDWYVVYTALILSIPTAAILIVGLIYWKNAFAIAGRMVSPDPTPVTSHPISVAEVMMVAFSTAGVFIFVKAVRDVVGMMYLVHRYDLFELNENGFWADPRTWSALAELALGLWLILGSRGIVRAIRWLRTPGVYELQDESEEQDG